MGAAACDAGSEISPASEGRGFFCFVHLFSGKNDVLARALQDEARACGLSVDAKAYDVTKDTRNDLLKDEPYLSILNQAKYGKWDGVHAGPPRGTFSAARWNQAWKLTVELEWWRHMLANKASEVSDLQVKWLESKQQEQKIPDSLPKPLLKRSFSWAAEHKGPDAKVSKRSIRDEENDIALGGMRNPWTAVKRLSKVAEVGRDIARCWRHFVRRWPEALSTAGDYGSKTCSVIPECVEAWRKELMQLLRGQPAKIVLKEKIEFSSPLRADLWEAWQNASDPEKYIAAWAREGVPLGRARPFLQAEVCFPQGNSRGAGYTSFGMARGAEELLLRAGRPGGGG
eukprot:s7742_g6.t1